MRYYMFIIGLLAYCNMANSQTSDSMIVDILEKKG